MDDSDEDWDGDWEIDKQTRWEYLEGGEGGKCNVRWVLEKGFNLGKKAVITGFVMSSAPVVLPPILVVSAVGFACSVPFGLVFTSYACTQKLMSTLLPMPIAPPMLEYDQMFVDEAEEEEERVEGEDRIESPVYMEEEEKEQMVDLREGVEERIELVKNENEVPQEEEDSKYIRRDDQMFDDEAVEVEGRVEGQDRMESRVYMEQEEKEQMDDLREGVEERIELVKNENEMPQEEDDSKDIRRDDQTFDDEAEEVEGREGKDQTESRVCMENEEKEKRDDQRVGVDESIELVKNDNVVPQEDASSKDIRRDDQMLDDEAEETEGRGEGKGRTESLVYMDKEEKEQMDDLREGVEERIELVKNGNEVPQEEEDSTDIRRDDQMFDDEGMDGRGEGKYRIESRVDMEEDDKKKTDDLRVGVAESIELVKNENEVPWEDDDPRDIRRDDQMFDDEAGEAEGIGEGKDRIEHLAYVEEEKKEQMDGLNEGLEESFELEQNENQVPEEEDSNNIQRDDELRMTSKNNSLKEEGYEEDDDEPLVYDNRSSEQMVAQEDVGLEESIDQERKSKELFPEEDALKSSDWNNSREEEGGDEWEVTELNIEGEGGTRIEEPINEEEKEKMNDLKVGEEESIKSVKKEGDISKDIRRDDEVRMTSENINLKEEGIEEDDDEPLVYSNESLEKLVVHRAMGREGSVTQESKGEELMPKEDIPIRPSEWTSSREDEGEWKVIEMKIEGEGDVGIEESTNEDEDIKRASVGLLEKIKDEGNTDAAAERTKDNKKKTTTSDGSVELLLPEPKDQSLISKNLTVGNGVTENRQSGPHKMQKLEDSSEVGNQHPPVGGASGSVDLIPSQENTATSYPLGKSEKTSDNGSADPIVVIGKVDVLEISVTETRPYATDGNTSDADSVSPTEKEFVDEEKIREQIDALRAIVGYKSTTYRSSIEEVKALYTFTGVELPSSFGNPPDLAELNNKLRFLMSILGVK